jgi:hypothetical protein
MSWKRATLAIGLWLNAAAAVALTAQWIASSAYRRDRLAMLIDRPELLTGVGPHLWVLALLVLALLVAGALALVWSKRVRSAVPAKTGE